MEIYSENKILADLKHNSREAFNQLFSYYYPRLMAYTSSLMGEEVAEDITQDVFLYVWENRQKLYVGKGFHSYLFQSAYTRSLDVLKKTKFSEKFPANDFQGYLDEYASLLKGDASALEDLYTKDFYHRLYELLDEIPEQRREVFVLTYINGMKAKEVAEMLDLPQRTVESHMYLATKYLKERMTKKDFFLLSLLIGYFN